MSEGANPRVLVAEDDRSPTTAGSDGDDQDGGGGGGRVAAPGTTTVGLRLRDQLALARARTQSGSGLGLAIVRQAVERHGGTVWAANRAGGGAVVGFELPVATT